MPGRLESKIAIVTGASSGIGRAISLAFHKEGATVVCADLSETARVWDANESGQEKDITTHEAIQRDGGKAIFVKTDVSSEKDVEAVVKTAVEKFGRLDIMVNCAGISTTIKEPHSIWNTSLDNWNKVFSVNAAGVFLGCKHASAQMIEQEPGPNGDRGWIVNLSSIYGLVGPPGAAHAYAASKHAVSGLTKSVGLELGPYRVHCNAICPGYVDTALPSSALSDPDRRAYIAAKHPFRGLGQPTDIAKAAVFLASDEASWCTGTLLAVDGGYTAQ